MTPPWSRFEPVKGKLCQINTSRRAVYGYDQRFEVLGSKGMLQAGNVRPTEVASYTSKAVSTDVPEAFFLERYSAAYATEMAQFFGAVREGGPVPITIEDRVRALETDDGASRSWAERKIITLSRARRPRVFASRPVNRLVPGGLLSLREGKRQHFARGRRFDGCFQDRHHCDCLCGGDRIRSFVANRIANSGMDSDADHRRGEAARGVDYLGHCRRGLVEDPDPSLAVQESHHQ